MICKRCGCQKTNGTCETKECQNPIFCERCGTKVSKTEINNTESYKCSNEKCAAEKFFNPIPVAVPVIRVLDEETGKISLLGVRRGIRPIGQVAFPGGFQEIELVLTAALRELEEETGVLLKEEDFSSEGLIKSSFPIHNRVLMFIRCNKILKKSEIDWSFKCPETLSMELINEGDTLAFPLHTEAISWGLADD